MLIGEYVHTLDDKKRLSLPAKFRKELGSVVVVTRGLDACLFLFSQNAWSKIAEKISGLPMGQADTRGLGRFLLSGASEVEVDSAGRVLVPEHLKAFAGLGPKVICTGMSNRVELWDEKKWAAYKQTMERDADRMAEKLGDLGMLYNIFGRYF